MRRPMTLPGMFCLLSILSLGTLSSVSAAEEDDSDAEQLPLARKKKERFNDNYRYDFEDRHLAFGINLGGGLGAGNTLNGFPYGGTVTPYFKGAFGDGNAVEIDVTVGVLPLQATASEWVFFRTPIQSGSAAAGYVGFVAPNVQFRYELELGSSISKRSPVLFWGGMGLGALVSSAQAELTKNGTDGVHNSKVSGMEVFFDIVPTAGFKLRLGEFAYLELGARQHILIPIASKLNDEESWTKGTPDVVPEMFINTARILDFFLGFSYDFG